MGIAAGILLSFAENQGLGEPQAFVAFGGSRAGYFILRFVGTCVVFYPFFLCRTIGAGDIKLMGVIAGFLGVWDSVFVIGLGMIFAAAAASYRMIKQGTVWFRLERVARFAVETGMRGRLTEYPGYFEKESLLRLGPYLFAGYCLFLLI